MTKPHKQSLLSEQVDLLVRHYGAKRVRNAIARIAPESSDEILVPIRVKSNNGHTMTRTNGLSAIEALRENSFDKYEILLDFYGRLKGREVLPESQDIRHFAQIIGLKDISGKSREDMLPKLVRFLVDQPLERLKESLEGANNISDRQRKMGYSVLTEKLLGKP